MTVGRFARTSSAKCESMLVADMVGDRECVMRELELRIRGLGPPDLVDVAERGLGVRANMLNLLRWSMSPSECADISEAVGEASGNDSRLGSMIMLSLGGRKNFGRSGGS